MARWHDPHIRRPPKLYSQNSAKNCRLIREYAYGMSISGQQFVSLAWINTYTGTCKDNNTTFLITNSWVLKQNTDRTQRSHMMMTTLLRTDTSADTSSSRANAGTHCFAMCSFCRHNLPTQYQTRCEHHRLPCNTVLINLLSTTYGSLGGPLLLQIIVWHNFCHYYIPVLHKSSIDQHYTAVFSSLPANCLLQSPSLTVFKSTLIF